MNHLYFGDSLDILRQLHAQHPSGFIDLVYIDPPFNSKRNYNILFETVDLHDAKAQKEAFADTWSNVSYKDTLSELSEIDLDLHKFLHALDHVRVSQAAVSYLTTMAIRIHYIHKVLKDTGSFYLHCDQTMSHYLKIVCDLIFGERNFINEITWKRSSAHNDAKQGRKAYGSIADVILFYAKGKDYTFNTQYLPYSQDYLDSFYHHIDEKGRRFRLGDLTAAKGGGDTSYDFYGTKPYKGRFWAYSKKNMEKYKEEGRLYFPKSGGTPSYKRYLDEMPGVAAQNVWDDIGIISPQSQERLGYPTQKPEALLERIISASSNEGDLVADFFCGCGTTVAAAEKLHRKWIGVDISHLAIGLIRKRLIDTYDTPKTKPENSILRTFDIDGLPKDIGSAKALALVPQGRMHFQDWVIETLLGGVANPKKTADGGYDGYTTFEIEKGKKEIVLIEVKSGNVNVKNVREFINVVDKQKATMGLFVCFSEQVTKPMLSESKDAGHLKSFTYDRIQIITIEDLLEGKMPQIPKSTETGPFKKAEKAVTKKKAQKGLWD